MLPRLTFDLGEGGERQERKVRVSKVTGGCLRSKWAGPTFKTFTRNQMGVGGVKIEDMAAESGSGAVKTKEMKRMAHSTTS